MRFSVVAAVLGCLLLTPPAAWATGETPGTYTYYTWPKGTSLEQVEFSLTPMVDPGYRASIFWSNQFNFGDGQTAYTGMQSNGGDPRQFLFSVWDATEARPGSQGSKCVAFDGEGRGRSCRMHYEWKEGHRYEFSVAHEGDRWFGVTVTDIEAGVSFKLGSIRSKFSRISSSDMETWTEYFEWNDDEASCFNQPYSQVRIRVPRGNGGTVVAKTTTSSTSKTCSDQSRIDNVSGGVVQSNAIGNSLRGQVTASDGECLDAAGGADEGTEAITYPCNGQDNQAWVLARNGSLQLQWDLCLDVADDARAPGSPVIVYSCNDGANQRWKYADGQLISSSSGLCLTAHNGDQLTVERCAENANNQKWRLPLAPVRH